MRKQKGSFVPGRSGRLGTLLSSVFHCSVSLISSVEGKSSLEINVCIHHIKMTNKMQLCRIIYYSIVLWLLWILGFLGFITIIMLCMFRAILSLIIRRILTVITASGFTHFCRCRPLSLQFRSCWWWAIILLETCWAVKEQWNNKLSYTVASCWSFL